MSTRKGQKQMSETRFGELRNCPESLKLIVRCYRFVGFSFSGLTFIDDNHIKNDRNKNETTNDNSSRIARSIARIALITINASIIASYSIPLFVIEPLRRRVADAQQKAYENQNNNNTFAKYFIVQHQYKREFETLKPILAFAMRSILLGMLVEGGLTYAHNLLAGGRLIRQLAMIGTDRDAMINKNNNNNNNINNNNNNNNIRSLDRDRRFAAISLGTFAATLITLICAGLALFNRKHIFQLYDLLFTNSGGENDSNSEIDRIELIKLMIFTTAHVTHYVVLMLNPLLFVYACRMVAAEIDDILPQTGVNDREQPPSVSLTENESDDIRSMAAIAEESTCMLREVENRLRFLSSQYHAILRHFSAPLTVSMTMAISAVIGTSCMLLLEHGNKKSKKTIMMPYYLSLIFDYGTFSFARISLLCVAGSWPSNAFDRATIRIYRHVERWSIESLLRFDDIVRRVEPRFVTSMLARTYSLRQSTLLPCLGFALGYIVVLLQTENYDKLPKTNDL